MILSGLDFSILDCHDFNITALSQVEVGLCWSQWSQHFWPPSCRLLEEKKKKTFAERLAPAIGDCMCFQCFKSLIPVALHCTCIYMPAVCLR